MTKAGELLTLMESTKKDRMNAEIKSHGEDLNAIFKTDLPPVTISKKLFSLENKLRKANVDSSNGSISEEELDKIENSVLAAVDNLLGYKAKGIPVYNQGDPRGNALVIDSKWISKNNVDIYRNMGGEGVLAPDFS